MESLLNRRWDYLFRDVDWSRDEEQLDCTSTTTTATENNCTPCLLVQNPPKFQILRILYSIVQQTRGKKGNKKVWQDSRSGSLLSLSFDPCLHVRSHWLRCDCDYWQLNREGNFLFFFIFFFKGEGKCDLMCCESLHYDPGVRTSRYPRRRVVLSFWHCWSDVSGVLYTITQDDQNIDSGSDSNSFGIKAQIYDMQTATQTFILSRISLGPIQSSGNIGVSTKGEEGKRLMCP